MDICRGAVLLKQWTPVRFRRRYNMQVWKYDETNTATHLTLIECDDSHVVQPDELLTLPANFMTPAKLVNGRLVSASEEESNASAVDVVKNAPSADQTNIATLMTKVAKLEQEVADLKEAGKDVSSN